MSSESKFIVRPARPDDAEFVSIGIREAQRCNVGVGIYDVLIGQSLESIEGTDREREDDASHYLKHCYLHDTKSHVHMSNFLVAVDSSNNQVVACCCNSPYPEFKLSASIPGFEAALVSELNYTEEKAASAFDNWSFLGSAFPDVDFDNTWVLEAVYVSPAYRGRGLAQLIVQANMDAQPSRKFLTADPAAPDRRFLIICAVGNDGAKRVYEKLGFKVVGAGSSDECMQAIHCSGFYVLST